jgi:hypothetical protein
MSRRGGHFLRSVAAISSLIILLFLTTGYLGMGGKAHITGSSSRLGKIDYVVLGYGIGRLNLSYDFDSAGTTPAQFRYGLFWDPPDFKRLLQQRFVYAPEGSGAGLKRYKALILQCPIWFAMLLCMFAPLIWLRKRPRPTPVGFAVITKTQAGV